MNRRGFLHAMLAACAAPAIVKASSLMPIFQRRESGLLAPSGDLYVVTGFSGQDTLLTPSLITREALRVLHKNENFISITNRAFDALKVGDVIKVSR